MMNERGKSDRPVVPVNSSNKAVQTAAEGMEGRGLTKGNLQQQNASRTQSRSKGVPGDRSSSLGSLNAPSALERIRQAASKDKEMRFTALFHHIYAPAAAMHCRPEASLPPSVFVSRPPARPRSAISG